MASSAETEDRRDWKSEHARVLEVLRETKRENHSYRLCAAHTEMKNAALESECKRLNYEVKTLRRQLDKMDAANALLTQKLEGLNHDAKQQKT